MSRTIFWDVDTQYDFMRSEGTLYVPDSESIIPALAALTEHAHSHGLVIVASADDHEPGHRELSDVPDWLETFPPHCMRGTPGQGKIPETTLRRPFVIEPDPVDPAELAKQIRVHDGDFLLLKHWFDVFTNANVGVLLDVLAPTDIVLYGVALDVCNRYAIEGLLDRLPSAALWLVQDATRPIHPDRVGALIEGWTGRGLRLATIWDVVEGRVPA